MRPALSADVRAFEPVGEGLEAELRLTVPSDVAYVEDAVELVARHLEASFLHRETIRFNLKVALTEALANAILFGNAEDSAKGVSVRVLFGRNTVQLEVTDEGGGFEAFLPEEEQQMRLLPRILHPSAREPLNRVILRFVQPPEEEAVRSLRPLIDHWRNGQLSPPAP